MKTISEVESIFPALMEVLRSVPLSPELSQAREFLLPAGFVPVVQLEEDGRKKRSSAASWNWSPKTGEIRIYFDPVVPSDSRTHKASPERIPEQAGRSSRSPETPKSEIEDRSASAFIKDAAADITPQDVIECCQALAVAEKSNRQFIALKWFRDEFLSTIDFEWAQSAHGRQRVLSHAIDLGRVEAKKIPNPKSSFPTTTINLNRSIPTAGVARYYKPIVVRGEPVSTTLLRDRGNA